MINITTTKYFNNQLFITTYNTTIVETKPRKVGIYIGRFQPLHNGHMNIIKKGMQECELFVIVIGSVNKNDDKNPFSYEERYESIRNAVLELKLDINRLVIIGLNDSNDLPPLKGIIKEDLWYYHLQNKLHDVIALVSYNLYLYASVKDPYTEDYLQRIKRIVHITEYVSVPVYVICDENINATDIRDEYKQIQDMIKNYFEKIETIVPKSTVALLKRKL